MLDELGVSFYDAFFVEYHFAAESCFSGWLGCYRCCWFVCAPLLEIPRSSFGVIQVLLLLLLLCEVVIVCPPRLFRFLCFLVCTAAYSRLRFEGGSAARFELDYWGFSI